MTDTIFAAFDKIKVQGRSAVIPSRVLEGVNNDAWSGRDGALVSMPWVDALVLEGRCFTFTVGTLSTAITGGGNGTVLDLDQPEFLISVPAGTVIRPLKIAVQTNCPAAITDNDISQILVCIDRASAWNADGTYTAETAYNMRTDNPRLCSCSCASAFTADMLASSGSDTVHHIDLVRKECKAEVAANGEVVYNFDLDYEPKVAPFIVGPALVTGYWGGTAAVTGYAQIVFAEWAKSELGIA